jgi:hypothetical protein
VNDGFGFACSQVVAAVVSTKIMRENHQIQMNAAQMLRCAQKWRIKVAAYN